MKARRNLCVLVLVVAVAAVDVSSQTRDALARFQLRQIAVRAGVIFTGKVMALEHEKPRKDEVGTMRITFRVERGLRGVHDGSLLTIREWEGLWSSGERYRVGERVALFLYPNSKLGLTSPVGGPQGCFAINASNEVVLAGNQAGSSADGTVRAKGTIRVPLTDFTRAVRRAAAQEK